MLRSALTKILTLRDADGQWWRSYGNELWEFAEDGLMRRREASINDVVVVRYTTATKIALIKAPPPRGRTPEGHDWMRALALDEIFFGGGRPWSGSSRRA